MTIDESLKILDSVFKNNQVKQTKPTLNKSLHLYICTN
jgi:hypothetical protein